MFLKQSKANILALLLIIKKGRKFIFISILEQSLIFALVLLIGIYSQTKNLYQRFTYQVSFQTLQSTFFWNSRSSVIVLEQRKMLLVTLILSQPTAQKQVQRSVISGIQILVMPILEFRLMIFLVWQSQQKGTQYPIRSISLTMATKWSTGISNSPQILMATVFYYSQTLYSTVIPFSSLSKVQPGLSNSSQQSVILTYSQEMTFMNQSLYQEIFEVLLTFQRYCWDLLYASSRLCCPYFSTISCQRIQD